MNSKSLQRMIQDSCHWGKRTNLMRDNHSMWQCFCERVSERGGWLAIFSNHWTSCNSPWVNKSTAIRAHETPFSTNMSPPISSIIIPLLRVSIISTSQDSIISLGSHYAGGHMQPYVEHRPPPCGVTLVIMRGTQSQTRRKAQNSRLKTFLWYYLSRPTMHKAFQPSSHLLSTPLVPRQRTHLLTVIWFLYKNLMNIL